MFSRSGSVVVILMAVSSMAFAESARDAYSRGLALYSAGRFAEAADAFVAAYEKKLKPLILFNAGQAYRKSGDLDKALTYYHRFLDEASPDERAPLEEETRKYVQGIEAEQASKKSWTDNADREADALKLEAAAKPPARPPVAAAVSPPSAIVVPVSMQAPPKRRSLARSWWLWTSVGAVAVGLAVGLGAGLGTHSNDPTTALGTRQQVF